MAPPPTPPPGCAGGLPVRLALVMRACLIFAADHLAVVGVGQLDALVAQRGAAAVRLPLLPGTLQLRLDVELVTAIAGILALLEDPQLLLVCLAAWHVQPP